MRSSYFALVLFALAAFPATAKAAPQPPLLGIDKASVQLSPVNGSATFRVRLKGIESSIITVDIAGGSVSSLKASAKDLQLGKKAKPWEMVFAKAAFQQEAVKKRGCLSIPSPRQEEDKLPSFDDLGLSSSLFAQFRELFTAIYAQVGAVPVGSVVSRCNLLQDDTKARFSELMNIALSGRATWELRDTCLFVDSEYLDDAYRYFDVPPAPQSVPVTRAAFSSSSTWSAVMRKNACKEKTSKSTYEVTFTARVKGKRPLFVRVQESRPVTKKAASIKPVSVGKLAPAPLLLMQSLGLCGQSATRVMWNKGAPRLFPVPIEDVISYRNLALNRAAITSHLVGGEGVFDLEDGRTAYGVCFSLAKTRQRVNGYPGE